MSFAALRPTDVSVRPVTGVDELIHVEPVRERAGFGPAIRFEMHYLHEQGLGEVFLAESSDGAVIGAAAALHFGDTGWLGGICVVPEARRAGIGSALTATAVEWLRERGASTTLLYATDLGRPVYARMGFVEDGAALAWTGSAPPPPALPAGTRIGRAGDLPTVLALDRAASGEDRSALLRRVWPDGGLVLERDEVIRAVAVPRPLGGGRTVLADDPADGAAFVPAAFGAGADEVRAIAPEGNADAERALRRAGLRPMWHCPRMRLGPRVPVQPARQFVLFNLFWG